MRQPQGQQQERRRSSFQFYMQNVSDLCLLFRWLADVTKQPAAALQPIHQNHKNRIEPKEPGTAGLKNEKLLAFSCQNKVVVRFSCAVRTCQTKCTYTVRCTVYVRTVCFTNIALVPPKKKDQQRSLILRKNCLNKN